MKSSKAPIVLAIFCLLAIYAAALPIHQLLVTASEVQSNVIIFEYDSGCYYLFVATVFWPVTAFYWAGLTVLNHKTSKGSIKHKMALSIYNYGNAIIVIWFIICLVLANVIPLLDAYRFEKSGYYACQDVRVISRVSRGESVIYVKTPCKEYF